jgi:protein-tyrosine phosphatase
MAGVRLPVRNFWRDATRRAPTSVLGGCANARDLGGLPAGGGVVRRGILIRSDALADLTDAGRSDLTRLGIRTVIDLRDDQERAHDPNRLDGVDVRTVAVPVLPSGVRSVVEDGLPAIYRTMLDGSGVGFARVVETLAEDGALPAVVHCSAGKDRTGLLVALLLELVGVDRRSVVADYALTSRMLGGEALDRIRDRALAAGSSEQVLAVAMTAPPDAIAAGLDHLRREYGGAEAYLRRHGVEPVTVERLRAALVEPR